MKTTKIRAVKTFATYCTALVALMGITGFASGCAAPKETAKPSTEKYLNYDSKQLIDQISQLISDYEAPRLESVIEMVKDKSIKDIQQLRAANKFTYAELTAAYLQRIKVKDQGEKGTNSFININPNVLSQAKILDQSYTPELVKKYPLYGMPISVKDNINTKDMATTAGSYALKYHKPADDAPVVKKLIENKGLIIGKNNLSEFAGYMGDSVPAGYTGVKGHTHHGREYGKDPSGSSSGSAASVAANYCVASVGTDTSGSIISPAKIHTLTGVKPTHGTINGEGIIPLANFMDTAGPITRTLADSAVLMHAMGHLEIKGEVNANAGAKGKRIGLINSGEAGDKKTEAVRSRLQKMGYIVVDLNIEENSDKTLDIEELLKISFQKDLNEYLMKYKAPQKSLKDIVTYNNSHKERAAKFGQESLEGALSGKYDKTKIDNSVAAAKEAIDKAFKENNVEAIAYTGETHVSVVDIAGYPVLTVPTDFTSKEDGLGIIGMANSDSKLISLGLAIVGNK